MPGRSRTRDSDVTSPGWERTVNRLTCLALTAALLAPASAAYTADGDATDLPAGRLYVTSWFGGVVSVVDLRGGTLRRTIPVGVQNHNVFLAPDRKTAWVTNNNDGTVTVLDTATNR